MLDKKALTQESKGKIDSITKPITTKKVF